MSGKPATWKTRQIRELFEIRQGLALGAHRRAGTPNVPFLRTSNVYWDRLELAELDQMTATDDEITKFDLCAGDVLVCEGGDIGRTAFVAHDLPGVVFQNHLHRLRAIDPAIDPAFFACWMDYAWNIAKMFQGTGNKTTIPNLSQSRLGSIDVPLPPLHEQHEIAGVLRSLRNAIDGSERVVETLTSLKRSHVDEVFRSDGAIGWPRFPCEAVALTITVGVVVRPASHYVPFGVPAFRSLNVREDRLVTKSLVYFDAVASNGILAKSRLRTGDVLVVRTGDPGVSCVVPPEHDGSNCIDIVLVRPDRDQVLPEFLSRFFNSPDARRFVGQAKTGLAQQHLNIGALRKLPVPLPPLGVQHRVVEILSAIDAKVDAERRRLAALEDLYRTLLHGLMTGALRVDDPAVARETAQLSLPAIPVE